MADVLAIVVLSSFAGGPSGNRGRYNRCHDPGSHHDHPGERQVNVTPPPQHPACRISPGVSARKHRWLHSPPTDQQHHAADHHVRLPTKGPAEHHGGALPHPLHRHPKRRRHRHPKRRPTDHLPERAFFQGFGPVAHLGFRASAGTARVRLTYRVPAAVRQVDPVTVVLNGHRLGDLPSVPSWTSAELRAGSGVLRDGVNRFELRWPCGGDDGAERRLADASRLARGDYPVVRAVQGELFYLTVEMDG